MQSLTREGAQHVTVMAEFLPGPAAAVEGIADDRMADMCHMDTNLMGAAGLELAGDQAGGAGKDFLDPVVRRRRLAAAGNHGHFFAILRVAADGALDPAACCCGHARDQGAKMGP